MTLTKPPTERGRRTWEKIVVAAAELFRSGGVRATSIEDVLVRSGCGKSQLYHHFSGKADLVTAVLEYQLDRFLAGQKPFLDELDSWPGIRRWLDELPSEFSDAPDVIAACPIGALAAELAGTDEQVRQALAEAFDRWTGHLAAGLTAMRDRGELTAEADPVRLARMTIATLQGGLLLARTYRDADLVHSTLEAAYAGLRSHARGQGPSSAEEPSSTAALRGDGLGDRADVGEPGAER
ncbi:AcrR family transcriptional regulator [Streptosporangium album]|uniref:AcrR family transcriptional regulator n=1 Tax=Streptosporangium album TaxID=47479 RepID=A0A7W7S1D5_9ACTN|nr:TetR/AcrR family transcriptional regulator [Streptosporangium album]MBB4941141.1 AcrR family transcriptional regulator [Streptosporangium album]